VGEDRNDSARDNDVTDGDAPERRLSGLAHSRGHSVAIDAVDRLTFVMSRTVAEVRRRGW
jgi:hypothetical protein